MALNIAEKNNWDRSKLLIISDSKYAIGMLMKKHRAKKNLKLIAHVKYHFFKVNGIEIIYTPGHLGIQGNEVADRLAKTGARKSRRDRIKEPGVKLGDYEESAQTPII